MEYWEQLNKEDIKRLTVSPLVTIGCHGYYHTSFMHCSIEKAMEEVKRNKLFLESSAEKNIDFIAFPYGHYTPELIKKCKEAGFKAQFVLDYLYKNDSNIKELRTRMTINPYLSVTNLVAALVKGKY